MSCKRDMQTVLLVLLPALAKVKFPEPHSTVDWEATLTFSPQPTAPLQRTVRMWEWSNTRRTVCMSRLQDIGESRSLFGSQIRQCRLQRCSYERSSTTRLSRTLAWRRTREARTCQELRCQVNFRTFVVGCWGHWYSWRVAWEKDSCVSSSSEALVQTQDFSGGLQAPRSSLKHLPVLFVGFWGWLGCLRWVRCSATAPAPAEYWRSFDRSAGTSPCRARYRTGLEFTSKFVG